MLRLHHLLKQQIADPVSDPTVTILLFYDLNLRQEHFEDNIAIHERDDDSKV